MRNSRSTGIIKNMIYRAEDVVRKRVNDRIKDFLNRDNIAEQ